ncbi:MAG: GlmU family protein [Bacteroidales bacterium]|nr:GlmU family protein [Tenuifilaceae bacterium]
MKSSIILFDDNRREQLLPLTFTRPVCMIRIGILTIKEKWEKMLNTEAQSLTVDYLSVKFKPTQKDGSFTLINGGVLPSQSIIQAIKKLNSGEALTKEGSVIAAILPYMPKIGFQEDLKIFDKTFELNEEIEEVLNLWDIYAKNGMAIENDFNLITKGRVSAPISASNHAVNTDRIFIEEGAIVECSVLNAQQGAIYIGKDAEVMEGSLVRGPFALCEHSGLKLGAKIYGPTTIGPYSKVGGEVNNSVIFGYTNKAHDGFLGNSVIGEWCNIGADTNTSNLKNNYAIVKLWNYKKGGFVNTGQQFCGLIMGDHSKCGINTMFNTGTIVGVSANIFGDGFPRNFIPSFSWGGAQGFSVYKTSQAFETAQKAMERRGLELSEEDKQILTYIFENTACYRH